MDSLVIIPTRVLEDLIEMSEAALKALDSGSPACPVLNSGLRGAIAEARCRSRLDTEIMATV